jgi:peptidoglycan/xylan/chitin deacetylase (PgdA/CDA1 family)
MITYIKRVLMETYYRYSFLTRFDFHHNKNVVFCFHGFIYPYFGKEYRQTSKKLLANILKAVSRKFKIVPLSELIEACVMDRETQPPCPRAAFTIDDGFSSTLDVMDVFHHYSVVPTIFICPKLVEDKTLPFPEIIRIAVLLTGERRVEFPKNNHLVFLKKMKDRISFAAWLVEYFKSLPSRTLESELKELLDRLHVSPEEIKNSPYCDPLLEWKQLRALIPSLEVGSHTCRHLQLSSLAEKEAEQEIAQSKLLIEDKLSLRCPALAYPFGNRGSFTQREEKYAEESGYQCALSLEPGYVTSSSPIYRLPRFNAGNGLQMLASFP